MRTIYVESQEDCSGGSRTAEGSLQGGSHHGHVAIRSVAIVQASSAESRQSDAAKPPALIVLFSWTVSDKGDKDLAIRYEH